MLSVSEVVGVGLIPVSFFLKPYVEICLDAIMVFYQQIQPLNDIPQVESHEQQFLLLCRVNPLMVQFYGAQFPCGEDNPADVDGIKPAANWKPLDVNNFGHFALV